MDGRACSEAIYEEADGDKEATGNHERDAKLGAARMIIADFKMFIDLIVLVRTVDEG